MFGSHGRYLRIDPRPGRTACVPLSETVLRDFLGGVGLGTWIVAHETPAGTHPLGAEAALVFTCNGRGARLFGRPHHDASVVAETLDDPAAAGFFAAGEFGPVGGRNFVHGFTASVVLFGQPRG